MCIVKCIFSDQIIFMVHIPFNMINSNLLIRISTIVQGISSHEVPRNWWTDFSSWSDLRALLQKGTLLPIHIS